MAFFSPVPKFPGGRGKFDPRYAGRLTGLKGNVKDRDVTLKSHVITGEQAHFEPRRINSEFFGSMDLSYKTGRNFNTRVTFQPDFSQV